MPSITTDRPGVTFAVDEVKPAAAPMEECRAHDAVRQMLDGEIESCSDYHGRVVREIHYQPLLAAVYTAFAEHRPLVLTPDAVWITIAQGAAQHMAIHGERLRERFVSHQGKLELKFWCRDWVEGSPENPWIEAFVSWSGQVRSHVGPEIHDVLGCDFSTSGAVERAVGEIVMMDIFQRYFHYVVCCVCGIPTVTLEGTPHDWQRLRDKAAGLKIFDFDWWLEHLLPICDQFVRASRGEIDLAHWRDMCKLQRAYGGDIINGWIAKLFPYLRAFSKGPCDRRNPIFETGKGFQTLVAPPGLSCVPFTWRNLMTGRERKMEAVGGLLGVTQDPDTLALRPKVGWAVREGEKMDTLLDRLAADHATFAPVPPDKADTRGFLEMDFPTDLAGFYHRTSGADLFGWSESAVYRIVPRKDIEPLNWGELCEKHPNGQNKIGNSRGPGGRIWHRMVILPDGSWLAINLDPNRRDPRLTAPKDRRHHQLFHPICHCRATTLGQPERNPVVALSFTELLEHMLESGGKPFWLEPSFPVYGDAERYTRRD